MAEFVTDDPVGLLRGLEADERFRRDGTISRFLHPGRICFREVVPEDSLHIVLERNRIRVHIDGTSPFRQRLGSRTRYSVRSVTNHNLASIRQALRQRLPGQHRTDDHGGDGLAAERFEALGYSLTAPVLRIPFNLVDEAVYLLDYEEAPWSIQLEVRVAGSFDEDRLRSALGQALGRHPLARARKVASRRAELFHYWEIPAAADIDPLQTVDCPDDTALDAARSDLHSLDVPLVESPPLRLRLARRPEGDVLMLNVNHAATDAFGALRILRSIARAYAGDPDPVPELDFLAIRDLRAVVAGDVKVRLRRVLVLLEKLWDLISPPARVAPDPRSVRPGFGLHHVALSGEETERLLDRSPPATVNDVLLAALNLTVARWNSEHGVPCGRVGVLVPVNLRPPEWREEMVGNFSLPTRLSTSRRDRATPRRALKALTARTFRKKKGGMGSALIEILSGSPAFPIWVKRTLVKVVWPLTANRILDTAILSSLGAVDEPPSFGPEAGETLELWFSPPTIRPTVAVGAVTVAGRLHLVVRYPRALFDADGAHRFATLYVAELDRLTATFGP